MTMRSNGWILLAALALLALPGDATGQERVWAFRQAAPGWIGLRVDFWRARVGSEERTVARIREVIPDSPAEAAGLEAGDTLTHVDGQFLTQEVFTSLGQSLEPGDLVRLTIVRDGRSREVLVEAEAPPEDVVIGPDAQRVVVELEALSGNILKSLDSLRLSIAGMALDSGSRDVTFHVLRLPGRTEAEREESAGFRFSLSAPFTDSLAFGTGEAAFSPDVPLPFSAMVVGSDATRAVRSELNRVRKELTSVRQQELLRRQELATQAQLDTLHARHDSLQELWRRDQLIQEMKERERRLLSQQEELARHLQQVSEEELQKQWVRIQSRNEEALLRASWSEARAREESRQGRTVEARAGDRAEQRYFPLEFTSPVLMGQSFILGAQMAPLNRELAQYFPVSEGVFVVQVVEGTPASEAGLQGGDIIVGLNEVDVTSLADLRFGLASSPGPWTLRAVRKSGSVEIVIRQ